jgi:hypothetical protein
MKYLNHFIVVFIFSFFNFSPNENTSNIYTTNCHQTFHFFFLSEGSPTFWIGEDVSGECNHSRLLQISIYDSAVSFSESELKEYDNWGNIPELHSLFNNYKEEPLELKGNVWENEDLRISPPAYDSLLSKEFNEHILQGGSNAITWFKLKGNKGIELPDIEGIKTELLFSYKTGLYINYEISEVHYFPKRYVVVFTHQPGKAVGLDTMHGFLIFKIKRGT